MGLEAPCHKLFTPFTLLTLITLLALLTLVILHPLLMLLSLLLWSNEAIMLLYDIAMWLYRLRNKMLGDRVDWMATYLTLTISRASVVSKTVLNRLYSSLS